MYLTSSALDGRTLGNAAPGACVGSGRYHLLMKLGEGGMGQVFKARHLFLDRVEAVKLLHPHLVHRPELQDRFRREARAAARLSHPNIVSVYDAGEDCPGQHNPRLYLAMEYVDGCDLARLMRRHGPLAPATVGQFLVQIGEGLRHAREQGLVHRDLKPSNLMWCAATGQVKILDLGLATLHETSSVAEECADETLHDAGCAPCASAARPTEERPAKTEPIMGTPDYMAPEQTLSAAVDIRADLYSLGCTAYHLLAGHAPFPGGDAREKILRHRRERARPLEQLRSDMPPLLLDVIDKLMAKNPADRFQNPAEFLAAMRPLAGEHALAPTAPLALVAAEDAGSTPNRAHTESAPPLPSSMLTTPAY